MQTTMKTEISQRLKRARRATGMKQSDLAESAGISVSSVRAYEQGRVKPPYDAVAKLAAALDCSHGELDPMPRYEMAEASPPWGSSLLARLEGMAGDGVQNLAQIVALLREMNERCKRGDCPMKDTKKTPDGGPSGG